MKQWLVLYIAKKCNSLLIPDLSLGIRIFSNQCKCVALVRRI